MQGAAGADALMSMAPGDTDDADALASEQGQLVRELFVSVWKALPAAAVCEGALGQRVLQTAIAAALPFLRRTLLLRAIVLGNIYIYIYIYVCIYTSSNSAG